MIRKRHYLFLLQRSPWPLLCRFTSFSIFFSFLLFVKFNITWQFISCIFNIVLISFFWWVSYSGEFNAEGKNSLMLEQGLKFSMLLFISSEVFFFFSFFWSYFHFFLAPVMEIGLVWPPYGVEIFNCLNVPLINTLVLITSGVTVTLSHHFLINGKQSLSNLNLFFTISLGVFFTILQLLEYSSSFFRIRDSTFGTTFFVLTGFHGIHVLVGSLFLIVVFIRFIKLTRRKIESLRFELASWYWHFVDVVWIFLYFFLYYINN